MILYPRYSIVQYWIGGCRYVLVRYGRRQPWSYVGVAPTWRAALKLARTHRRELKSKSRIDQN